MRQVTGNIRGQVWDGVYLKVSACKGGREPECFWTIYNSTYRPIARQVRDLRSNSIRFVLGERDSLDLI
jgi:hypothetical protein